MIDTIDEFLALWTQHSDGTRKMLGALTDKSLSQAVADDHRTSGRIAWHITGSIVDRRNAGG